MPSSAWRSTLFPYTTLFRSDRKSTRLNSSHSQISYAVFCLKKKTVALLDTDTVHREGPGAPLDPDLIGPAHGGDSLTPGPHRGVRIGTSVAGQDAPYPESDVLV